jgi:hypothetical protein
MQFFDARKRTVVDMSKEMDAGGNPYKKKESPRAVNVAEAVDAVMRMAGIMDKVLKASYHPKAELVDLVAKLNQCFQTGLDEGMNGNTQIRAGREDIVVQLDIEDGTEGNKDKVEKRDIKC